MPLRFPPAQNRVVGKTTLRADLLVMMCAPEFPDVPFTAADAKRLGISSDRLRTAVRDREVRRVLRNVYVRADVPDTQLVRCQAALLVLSPFSVVCDRTAAWLLGVDVVDYRELEILPPLETYVLRGHTATRRAECAGGKRDLSPDDIIHVHGVPVTKPLRTAMDLGCKLSRRDALAALDAFMRAFGITHAEMRAMLRRYFRRRGAIQLRTLIPIADPRAESPGESWTRLEIIDAGLPVPELQWWVYVGGAPTFRLDLAYPRHKIMVEYDGQEFHTSDEQRERDHDRRKWLRDHGWTVIVVDKDSFTPEALGVWLGELRAALRLAS